MGYYMGDFYGIGRGDPGFFSFLGKAMGSVGSLLPGVGGIVSKVGGKIAEAAAKHPKAAAIVKSGVHAIAQHPAISAAGAAGVMAAGTAAEMVHRRGSKAAAGMAAGMGGRGGGFGRRKHMNVCNPKALRRAVRRTHGFAKLAMKTIHLVHPKKHVTFGGFRKRRKKR